MQQNLCNKNANAIILDCAINKYNQNIWSGIRDKWKGWNMFAIIFFIDTSDGLIDFQLFFSPNKKRRIKMKTYEEIESEIDLFFLRAKSFPGSEGWVGGSVER